MSGQQVPGVRI